ncbi:MAG: DUF1850 domain-containing protein [Defluviitaleaceae bacterium]|nr:DUF1850 domain-containing protein [Defluviitaleaceae bacterium]
MTRFETDDILFFYPVYEGFEFAIEFVHSVTQSPVREFFKILEGEFYLTAIEFNDFGAGMLTEFPPGAQITHRADGGLFLSGFVKSMRNGLRYIVGRATCIVLYIGGERVPLADLAEPGTVIEFTSR